MWKKKKGHKNRWSQDKRVINTGMNKVGMAELYPRGRDLSYSGQDTPKGIPQNLQQREGKPFLKEELRSFSSTSGRTGKYIEVVEVDPVDPRLRAIQKRWQGMRRQGMDTYKKIYLFDGFPFAVFHYFSGINHFLQKHHFIKKLIWRSRLYTDRDEMLQSYHAGHIHWNEISEEDEDFQYPPP